MAQQSICSHQTTSKFQPVHWELDQALDLWPPETLQIGLLEEAATQPKDDVSPLGSALEPQTHENERQRSELSVGF